MATRIDYFEELGGKLRRFALPIGKLEDLDERTGAGPLTVLTRLLDGSWRLPDVRETIRLGLEGGGMTEADALALIKRRVDAEPLENSVMLAADILLATLRGREVEDAGNDVAAMSTTDPTTGSTSPPSDETQP